MKSITSNTLFERIIREEYNNAKIKKTIQREGVTTKSRIDPNYKPKPAWPGKVKAYNILKSLGAKPFNLGINDDGMELELYQNGSKNDRMQFNIDNTVYSEDAMSTLGWKISKDGKSIDILSDSDNYNDIFGTIHKGTSKPNNYIPDPTRKKEQEKADAEKKDAETYTKTEKTLDTIETILDWVGFVPVVGDFGDIINAIIKFSRGKIFEGLLSSIAIIPIAGSAISIGMKLGIKSLSKAGKGGKLIGLLKRLSKNDLVDPKTSKELWKQFVDNKILKKDDLAKLGGGFKTVAEKLKTGTNWIVGNAPITAKAKKDLLKTAAEWEKFIKQTGENVLHGADSVEAKILKKSQATEQYSEWIGVLSDKPQNLSKILDDAAGSIDKAAAKANRFGNAIPILGRTAGKVAGAGPAATSRVTKIFASIADKLGYSQRKLLAISNVMAKKFVKQWDNPTSLSALLHTAPNKKQLKDLFHNSEAVQQINLKYMKRGFTDTPKAWESLLNKMKQHNPELYKDVSDAILGSAIDPKTVNPFYAMFKASSANQLKTMFSKDIMKSGENWTANLLSKGKWVDILGSELEDVAEAIGFMDNDEKNGFIADGIFSLLYNMSPQLFDSLSTIKKRIEDTGIVQTAIRTGKETIGVDPETYNPEIEKTK